MRANQFVRYERCEKGHDDWSITREGERIRRRCKTCRRARSRSMYQPTGRPRGRPARPAKVRRIPVAPIREAVQEALRRDPDLSYTRLADRLGWSRANGKADEGRVSRILGVRAQQCGRTGHVRFAEVISEAKALEIIRAVHVDPWEVGL